MSDEYPYAQLAITLLITFASLIALMIVAIVIAIPFWGSDWLSIMTSGNYENPQVVGMLKYMQIMQSIGLFILPPIFLAYVFSGNIPDYLKVNKNPGVANALIVAVVILSSVPFINYFASLNAMIRFPEALSGLEQWFMEKEQQAQSITELFLKTTTVQGLALNILMIGILPALGEELFFRGILQRIFTNWTRNIHWGIIITSFIFSASHLQFYGFFPRWLLGALFGYLLVWSGSLWLPMVAHFINNSAAVILYFLIARGSVNEKMADIGSSSDILPYTVLLTLIAAVGFFYLYKGRKARA
jgi:membrane protease YdiL (CAAX protease family)